MRFAGAVAFVLPIVILTAFEDRLFASPIRTVYLTDAEHGDRPPTINDLGQVAFSHAGNVYVDSDGGLAVVASITAKAPGLQDGESIAWLDPYLDNTGGMQLIAVIQRTGQPSQHGIYDVRNGEMQLLARPGAPAPGIEGVRFSTDGYAFTSRHSVNDAGRVLFQEHITGPGVHRANNTGLWTNARGSLELVVREGDAVPESADGWVFHELQSLSHKPAAVNDRGEVAFNATIGRADADWPSTESIWVGAPDGLKMIAKRGDPVPGSGNRDVWHNLSDAMLSDSGSVVFFGRFFDGSGIFVAKNGGIERVVVSGDRLATDASAVLQLDRYNDSAINGAGEIAFIAGLEYEISESEMRSTAALIKKSDQGLQIVARNGDQAPGLDAGVVFSHLAYDAQIALNDSRQVAFARLAGTNPSGIWAQDQSGDLKLIAAPGQKLEVLPGDFRTIEYLEINDDSYLSGRQPAWFNDLGEIAFRARFADGSWGIFVSNAVAVPEPATTALGVLGMVLVVALRAQSLRESRR